MGDDKATEKTRYHRNKCFRLSQRFEKQTLLCTRIKKDNIFVKRDIRYNTQGRKYYRRYCIWIILLKTHLRSTTTNVDNLTRR